MTRQVKNEAQDHQPLEPRRDMAAEPWESLQRTIRHRYFIPVCIVSAVVVRLVWIWLVDAPQVSDFAWYYQRGITFTDGKGYSVDGIPTAYWPVGYPGLLGILFSIVGPSLFIAKLVNIVLYVGTMVLTYSLSNVLFRSELAARVTVLILAFYPNHIAYTALLSTEILFIFLIALGAVLFVQAQGRTSLLFLSGIAWGLATLTKPQGVAIPALFLLLFFSSKRSLVKSAVVIYMTLFATIVPWIARNYTVVGKPILSTNGGILLLIGNNPYATGRQIWDDNVKALLGDLGTDDMFDGKEVEREAKATELAVDYMRRNPIRTVLLWPTKLIALYASDVEGIYYTLGMMHTAWAKNPVLWYGARIVAELYYLIVLLLCCVSLPSVLRQGFRPQQIGFALLVYFSLTYLVFIGNARYHFPLVPWMAIYAGIGVEIALTFAAKVRDQGIHSRAEHAR